MTDSSEHIFPLSIVVCTRDREVPLIRLLDSLICISLPELNGYKIEWDVVIIDNNDTPMDPDKFDTHRSHYDIRHYHEPVAGLSRARNRALDEIGPARHIIWIDDDVTVTPDWLSVYERAFRYWPEFDCFGGPVVAQFEGGSPEWITTAIEIVPEVFSHIDPAVGFVEIAENSNFLPFGANMAFRAGVLESSRFDTRLGRQPGALLTGGEESSLFKDFLRSGKRGLWLPPAKVSHWIDASRQSLRQIFDHALGEALLGELIECEVNIEEVLKDISSDKIEQLYRHAASSISNIEGPTRTDIEHLKELGERDGRALALEIVPTHFRRRYFSNRRRVLVIGLDGISLPLINQWIISGYLSNFEKLYKDSATFELDHGSALKTGLAWEHFSTGRSPAAYQRYSAVDFDTNTYAATQRGTYEPPFVDAFDGHTVVFDVPYFDIRAATRVSGMTNWGSHDPGVARDCRPVDLTSEIYRRFGEYPAHRWIYGFSWPNTDLTDDMVNKLVESVNSRSTITNWLLTDRFKNWDLAITTISELHSATEGLWHGVDNVHPLYGTPSTDRAGKGMLEIFQAVDRFIGDMRKALPDTDIITFSMHGMSRNGGDVATMLLLPELLFRYRFNRSAFTAPDEWLDKTLRYPPLDLNADWSQAVNEHIHLPDDLIPQSSELTNGGLAFMPVIHYQRVWRYMTAFALPAFYDGRVRLNVKGRERYGQVPVNRYRAVMDDIIQLVCDCRDYHTGQPVVKEVYPYQGNDPLAVNMTDCDLSIEWNGLSTGFIHPQYGIIGPAPVRRPGGHDGPGIAWITADGITPGYYGQRSSFDVVPTVLQLLGVTSGNAFSGRSLFNNE